MSSAPAPHLVYYGGRVVSNLQVVQVLYGSGSYNAQVASTGSPSMATFYQGVLNSPYVDWLSEYDTNAQPAPESNQLIGRGAFVTQVAITPSVANDGPTIDDANIQAELVAQIQAGVLPAPTQDAAGNNNTYYAVFFPHGKLITLEGSSSCVFFCAYHGTVANVPGVGEFYYGVHPDFQVGSGCENECGVAATEFGNVTQVASHEMTETITDPEVGIAPGIAAPLAWYDTFFGEIGDICNDEHATIVGGDGVTYDVQTEFSNVASACIVSRALVPTITAAPLTFEGGTAVTGTVSLDAPAPAGGVSVALASGSAALVGVPANVLVPAGSVSATFPVTSVQTAVKTTVTLTAMFPTATATVNLTVLASPTVAVLNVAPTSVTNGAPAVGTVTLSGPAPTGGAVVTLASSDTTSAGVPSTMTIPPGASTGTFPITSVVRATTTTVTLSASYHDSTRTASLTVTGIPAVLEVLLTPTSIEGGSQQEAGGVVPLSSLAPPDGAIIYMAASDPTIVSLLPIEGVAPNADGIGFDLTTTPVLAPTVVTISATYPAGFTQSAPLLVLPPGNAVFDPSLKVPRCPSAGRFCDTGGTLVLGRANIANGAEPNTPNTLGAACPDGTSGIFRSNESLDRLSITTLSGDPLAAGEMVRVDTSVYAVDNTDSLDVFFAPDATNPVWTLMGTIPSTWFQREMAPSIQFVLPAATLPAIRANWRRGGAPGPCTTGPFDDRDDLVFALASGGPGNHAPTANAGPDQTVNQPASANLSGSASDDGLPSPPGKLATAWTTVTGPTAAIFADPTALVTTATFWVTGTYTLRLTVSDGALTASDDVVVTVNLPAPINQPPVVNAGPDQTITLPASATLAGGASDDGLPNPPATLTTTWSVVSGPGTVTFANAADPTTTATFSVAGTYDLRLSGSDSALSASDDVVVTVLPAPPVNKPPVVNAGSDQTLTLPAIASLTGTVTDDGLPNPPARFTTTWSKVSGPGTVTFANAANPITTATFSAAGTYDLRLTANDSALSGSDDLIVTVNAAAVNKAPVVNAGPDQTITLPAAANLSGTVTDDGLPNPPGAVTVTWSKVSGPGTVTFGNSHAKATTGSFSTSGSYMLRLTASDSALSAGDDVAVTVKAAPANKAPVVNAGPDLTITLPATASLNSTVTDDGLPSPPAAVTVAWSKVSGPGTVTFANSAVKLTTASFSAAGTYVVRLTASDSALSASDTAQITVNAAAGPCASLCSNPINFTDNGGFQSGNLGTGAVCYQTTSAVHGGNCGNFVSPRTLKVNGITEPCTSGNWPSVPAARNGGYCVQATAGNQSFAHFAVF